MSRKDLAEYIAKNQEMSMAGATRVVNIVFNGIAGTMAEGAWEVVITGFGTFSIKERPERAGRNPRTGEKITIPASRVVSFKPSKSLNRLMEVS